MPDVDRDDQTTFWRDQREQRPSLLGINAPAELDAMRDEAVRIVCPDCHAPIDVDCTNAVTGEPLRRFPCHARRLTTARKANG